MLSVCCSKLYRIIFIVVIVFLGYYISTYKMLIVFARCDGDGCTEGCTPGCTRNDGGGCKKGTPCDENYECWSCGGSAFCHGDYSCGTDPLNPAVCKGHCNAETCTSDSCSCASPQVSWTSPAQDTVIGLGTTLTWEINHWGHHGGKHGCNGDSCGSGSSCNCPADSDSTDNFIRIYLDTDGDGVLDTDSDENPIEPNISYMCDTVNDVGSIAGVNTHCRVVKWPNELKNKQQLNNSVTVTLFVVADHGGTDSCRYGSASRTFKLSSPPVFEDVSLSIDGTNFYHGCGSLSQSVCENSLLGCKWNNRSSACQFYLKKGDNLYLKSNISDHDGYKDIVDFAYWFSENDNIVSKKLNREKYEANIRMQWDGVSSDWWWVMRSTVNINDSMWNTKSRVCSCSVFENKTKNCNSSFNGDISCASLSKDSCINDGNNNCYWNYAFDYCQPINSGSGCDNNWRTYPWINPVGFDSENYWYIGRVVGSCNDATKCKCSDLTIYSNAFSSTSGASDGFFCGDNTNPRGDVTDTDGFCTVVAAYFSCSNAGFTVTTDFVNNYSAYSATPVPPFHEGSDEVETSFYVGVSFVHNMHVLSEKGSQKLYLYEYASDKYGFNLYGADTCPGGKDSSGNNKICYSWGKVASNGSLCTRVKDPNDNTGGWWSCDNKPLSVYVDTDAPSVSISVEHSDDLSADEVRLTIDASDIQISNDGGGIDPTTLSVFKCVCDNDTCSNCNAVDSDSWVEVCRNGCNIMDSFSSGVLSVNGEIQISDLHGGKAYSFKVSVCDLAGNCGVGISSPFVVGAPWFISKDGDVYSNGGWKDYMQIPSYLSQYIAVYNQGYNETHSGNASSIDVIISNYVVNPTPTSHGLYKELYDLVSRRVTQSDIYDNVPLASVLSNTSANGVYVLHGRQEILSLQKCYGVKVIFIDSGDLIINKPVEFDTNNNNSACLFIVDGDVLIDSTVGSLTSDVNGDGFDNDFEIDAGFIVDGKFTIKQGKKLSNQKYPQYVINGFVVANGCTDGPCIEFDGDLVLEDNEQYPAEVVNYDPRYLVLLKDYFGSIDIKNFTCGIVEHSGYCGD